MATHHEKQNQHAAAEKNQSGMPEAHTTSDLPDPNRDEATQERLDEEAEDAGTRHPNRGHNKADNGKGSYS
ncbi:MAG: hypothetical protein ACRYFK_06945 [Janthinobacterium lividum]